MRTIFEANDAKFEVDDDLSIFSFTWNGVVSETSVKKIFSVASRACAVMESLHWLIDRRNLEGYSPEARVWIKENLIQKLGKELIDKTDKIAAVESESAIAQVSSNVLIDAIRKVNPKIEYQEFDIPGPASNWLLGQTEEAPVEKKRRGLFRRRK